MKIIVLTSSRADYTNYLPLLKKLQADDFFDLHIIAFGTHVSQAYGNTVDEIYKDGFRVAHKLETLSSQNDAEGISLSMARTIEQFAGVWRREHASTDLVICLGDRYEMFAAVSSIVPFTIPIAHLYGGDTTLGAIDDVFRHAITLMSTYHFTSLESSAKRVQQLTGSEKNVYAVGTLSLDNLNEIQLLNTEQFFEKYNIRLERPVLVTFHPETVEYKKNEAYVKEVISVLETLTRQIVITMPNADTMGELIRKAFIDFARGRKNVHLVESLGTVGYFSCMQQCDYVIGNSSSGIVEAASFGKYVLDLGKRQLGRMSGNNVIHVEIDRNKILEVIRSIPQLPKLSNYNIYGDGKAADRIVTVLKNIPQTIQAKQTT